MDFQNQYEKEKHDRILKHYKDNVGFFHRGSFKVHLSTVCFFLWIFIWVESAIRYYSLDYVDFSIKNPRIYILAVVLLIIGWRLFKPYRSITEKNCFGRIVDISVSKRFMRGKSMGRRVWYIPVVAAKITIDAGGEKKHTITCNFNPNSTKILEKGAYITVIMGEKYPVCHDLNRYNGELFCTNCSSMSGDTFNVCFNCRKRLWIKGL